MKLRVLAVAGGVAALGALGMIPAHAAPGTNNGNCGTTAPTPGGTQAGLPDGGTAWGDFSSPTSGGSGGVVGPHGYLYASGNPSGGAIQGSNPDTGLNGSNTGPNNPTVCAGDTNAGVGAHS